ncbi:MAG: addiction module protein [Myxococcales bacterium]|nr:addiction module protein [Myxococcales bacterium]
MIAVATVFEQALQLPDAERSELLSQLLRSFEPDDDDELTGSEWEAAWATEIDDRVRELREGRVELIDGDAALAQVRASLAARRR